MRVAIIGSGIAGLTATHYLHRRHDVTLFEAHDYAGGHTHTVEVESAGERLQIDTGFIVFNHRTYPRFVELLTELGIASRPTEMSFSVSDERDGLEYNGGSLNGLFAQRGNIFRPRFYRFLAEIIRFNRQTSAMVDRDLESVTVGDFLYEHGYSAQFREQYLLPMGAAIWSCPRGAFASFPLQFVLQFFRNHGLLGLRDRPVWRVIEGGSRTYVDQILARFRGRLRLKTPIERVRRCDDEVEVQPCGGASERFDHVIFACHSDQALRILGEQATDTERAVLSAIPYERNVAVLHSDPGVLPRSRRAWASWNFRIRREDPAGAPVDVTYNMNILQGLRSPETFCVTLNPRSDIHPRSIIGEYVYHHPVFTLERAAAQRRHAELCGPNRTSFCGAYWRNGFHEDGVVSALTVVDALDRSARTDSQAPEVNTGAVPVLAGSACS